MFALILIPVALFWTADNNAYLDKMTDARWDYLGYTERAAGPAADGSQALTLDMDGKTFILFKQRPVAPAVAEAAPFENAEAR